MKVFAALNYSRDHETQLCGVAESREEALRMVEQARGESLFFSRDRDNVPDGSAGIDDHRGDCVGRAKMFEVFGSAKLDWRWNEETSELEADSIFHDDGSPLVYCVSENLEDTWLATFEGSTVCRGSLTECLIACSKCEDEALQKPMKEAAAESPERQFIRRLLNPEELGRAVPAHVRDDAREVLGMARVES